MSTLPVFPKTPGKYWVNSDQQSKKLPPVHRKSSATECRHLKWGKYWYIMPHMKIISVFYPTASGIEAFREELAAWQGGKGSVRFPIKKPLPLKLIAEIVTFRVTEIREAENIKKKK
jgi:hypothetical protein